MEHMGWIIESVDGRLLGITFGIDIVWIFGLVSKFLECVLLKVEIILFERVGGNGLEKDRKEIKREAIFYNGIYA